MKRLVTLLAILVLSGCTTNGVYDAGKTWALVGAVTVGGIVASQSGGSDGHGKHQCGWNVGPNGSTPIFC